MRSVHLVCNAHLDPLWLWEWEEGAAEAISTFRVAAEFCEEYDGFVFNHNEAILYRWVEEYDPPLFRRIQRLVRQRKWHIMGGWWLQPDCNMPSGESFVRQIMLGRLYFREKFGVAPRVAVNLDSFGHTRGLVQILAKSGYDGYLFCRPHPPKCVLASDEFVWEGYDGSRVLATRAFGHYGSARGEARSKTETLMKERPSAQCTILLWGVGNHGGGASRADLEQLRALIRQRKDAAVRHSTPEAYFAELRRHAAALPVRRRDINAWAVGCYTSQVRIKQRYRALENQLYLTEKMIAAAWSGKLMDYPADDLHEAMRCMATAQFHDILPGDSIQPVEEMSLRLMEHAMEILSRVRARAFFSLSSGLPRAKAGQIPVMVYNPHPFPVNGVVECEFQLADQNWKDTFTDVTVLRNGDALPSQVEKEASNLTLDWRKRVAFRAELKPSQMNRFDCRLTVLPRKPEPRLAARNGIYRLKNGDMDVMVNARTGLLDRYRVGGVDCLAKNSCLPLVIMDNADPWGMRVTGFRKVVGRFRALSARESARFSGVRKGALPAVRVIEDGPVRSVIEAVLGFGNSRICLRYKLPKEGTAIEIEVRVLWNEKDRMLKLSLPTPDSAASFRGQVAYGQDALSANGDEAVAQKWVAVVSKRRRTALTVINDGVYGSDCCGGELRLSLIRSAAYAGHPILDRPLVPQDRFSPRNDQGERLFNFVIQGGPARARLDAVDREALVFNEKPMALSFFPSGGGEPPRPFLTLSDRVVQVTALKKAEAGDDLVIRLFEPTGRARSTVVSLPSCRMRKAVSLRAFEIRTYRVNVKRRTWREVDLMEREVNRSVTSQRAEGRA